MFDYYGKKAAVASGDKCLIYSLISSNNSTYTSKKIDEIKGHDGPILSSSWAHPQFGSIIGTIGIDGKVIFHREDLKGWEKIYIYDEHKATPLCIAFNPNINNSNTLQCIVGYSDGKVLSVTYTNDSWNFNIYKAHNFSVNYLIWLNSSSGLGKVLTAGADGNIILWNTQGNKFEKQQVLDRVHESPIKMLDIIYSNDESSSQKQNHFISLDSDDTLYLWYSDNSTGSLEFKYEQVKFNQEQTPSGIIQVSYKEALCISVSTSDSTFLFKKVDKEWVIFASTNTEGAIINYE